MKRLLVAACALALSCVFFSGCGSSSGPSGGGSDFTPEERVAALSAVSAKIPTLTGADGTARRAEMLAFLRGRPEFEEAGEAEDGSLWARFTDDRLLIIIANEELPSRGRAAPVGSGGRGVPAELPVNPQAQVSVGFGPSDTFTAEAKVDALLAAGGYNLMTRTGSIDDLKRVAAPGVLFHQAHGGIGEDRQGNGVFTITSSTLVTPQKERDLDDDWQKKRLVYAVVTDYRFNFIPVDNSYYGINAQFVRDYWSFSGQSMAFLAACGSGGTAARDLRRACIAKGAGVVFGWTRPVLRQDSNDAAYFAIDRLLGANTESPVESPKQRPFDFVAVKADMNKRGIDVSNGPKGTAELIYEVGTESGVLAPTLEFMDVNEKDELLILTGKFGSQQGRVEIDGQNVTIKSWAKEKIEVNLPLNGRGSKGDVQVFQSTRKSNKRRLTEWKGDFTNSLTSFGTWKWEGPLKLRFRADIGDYRKQPGVPPVYRAVIPIMGCKDISGSYTASGTYQMGSWVGSGTMVNGMVVSGSPNEVICFGDIKPETSRLRMVVIGMVRQGMSIQPGNAPLIGFTGELDGPYSATDARRCLDLTLDSDWSIPAGQRIQMLDGSPLTLKWPKITPSFPPDPQGARGVERWALSVGR